MLRGKLTQVGDWQLAARHRLSRGNQVFGLRSGKLQLAQRLDIQFRDRPGAGVRAEPARVLRAKRRDQFAAQCHRRFQADLLAHDRPSERFPGLGRKRYAQAALTLEQGPEQWIVRKLAFETGGVAVDPEHPDHGPVRGESVAPIQTNNGTNGGRTVMERYLDQRWLTVNEQSFI